jgi:hypothetical protein
MVLYLLNDAAATQNVQTSSFLNPKENKQSNNLLSKSRAINSDAHGMKAIIHIDH